ncbi:MAG TPA: AAA family ATPase [Longimicrobiaceae bacterium]|nr:AAA family ATPase [Longimicrobiaceae bacterium]
MPFKIRRLELRASTTAGLYGADVEFTSGLFIISAGNTSGKSTLLQAIIYALGLERMLSARRHIPLAYAMRTRLKIDRDSSEEEELDVIHSHVALEIENGRGEILTIQRPVTAEEDTRLISTWSGPKLSRPNGAYQQRDFFALDPGSASREAGFNHMLAKFIGWDLPRVTRFDGGEIPLYMEAIFPLLFVEQKAGWNAIPANFPTYLQIRDMGKRAVEFLLGFEAHSVELQRQRLRLEIQSIRNQWTSLREQLARVASAVNGRVSGVPPTPDPQLELAFEPPITVATNGKWLSLDDLRDTLSSRITFLRGQEIPPTERASPAMAAELESANRRLQELTGTQSQLFREVTIEHAQQNATRQRIDALVEDLAKNVDARKLATLGSKIQVTFSPTECPTCHQSVSDVLLPQDVADNAMTIDDNISFIREQLDMLTKVLEATGSSLNQKEKLLLSVNAEIAPLRARIRTLKQSLIAPSGAPSAAVIEERVTLETQFRTIRQVEAEVTEILDQLRLLAERYPELVAREAKLPKGAFTPEDLEKLRLLERSVVAQLVDYGFKTFSPRLIEIDPDTYRPARAGFEIGFELSASDTIRLKWAYQIGLLEVGKVFITTNHPGVLIFDEPGQQDVEKPSFRELLRHAAQIAEGGQQIIFATSEDFYNLQELIADTPSRVVRFDGFVLHQLG